MKVKERNDLVFDIAGMVGALCPDGECKIRMPNPPKSYDPGECVFSYIEDYIRRRYIKTPKRTYPEKKVARKKS